VGNTYPRNTGGTSLSWTHTIGTHSNNLLVVGVTTGSSSSTVSSVTYNGINLTQLTAVNCPNSAPCRNELWYLVNPSPGAHTVQVNFLSSASITADSVSYYNVDQVNPFATFTTNTGNSSNPTVTIISNASQLVIDYMGEDSTYSISGLGSGQTEEWGGCPRRCSGESDKPAGASSTTMSWNMTGADDYAEIAGALNPFH